MEKSLKLIACYLNNCYHDQMRIPDLIDLISIVMYFLLVSYSYTLLFFLGGGGSLRGRGVTQRL